MVVELANRSNVVWLGDDVAARSTNDDESANDPSSISVAFSGDGNRLAIASRNRIEVWEWRTRRLLHLIEQRIRGSEDYNSTVKVAFDEDDNDTVITADMYEAVVWNLSDCRKGGGGGAARTEEQHKFLHDTQSEWEIRRHYSPGFQDKGASRP